MKHELKVRIKRMIPPRLLNAILLSFPALYRTELVNFESNLVSDGGIEDLLSQLGLVTSIEGHIIECGSSRCGTSIIMANFLKANSVGKKVYALDSFKGFDPDELSRERQAGLTDARDDFFASTSYEYVAKKIKALGLEDMVTPVEGYFRQTLPTMAGLAVCYALIDCDLKDSLVYCAETIWPMLSPRGRIVFDDYADARFAGARIGVDGFLEVHAESILEHGMLNRLYYVVKK
jgi:hypothetical protein